MNHSIRPQLLIPGAIVLGIVVFVLAAVIRSPGWDKPEAASSEPTVLPSEMVETPVRLAAWTRPSTTDPKVFAVGYARAIWTYDTTKHSLEDWQNAVSVFAAPTGEGPRIATSLLPIFGEWQQLELHKASATVDDVAVDETPDMRRLQQSANAPKGWTGFVVHGRQTTVLDGEVAVLGRQAAVGVVCTPTCKFWSASAQINP